MTTPAGVAFKIDEKWESLADIMYPVGSVFISNRTDLSPASQIGGQWARVAGVYLRCANDDTVSKFGGTDQISWTYGLDWLSWYGLMPSFNQDPNECYFGLWNDNTGGFVPGTTHNLSAMSGVYNSNMSPGTYVADSCIHKGRTTTVNKSILPSFFGVAVWYRTA